MIPVITTDHMDPLNSVNERISKLLLYSILVFLNSKIIFLRSMQADVLLARFFSFSTEGMWPWCFSDLFVFLSKIYHKLYCCNTGFQMFQLIYLDQS